MPELPEVETIVRKLQQVLPGKKILGVTQLHAKTWQGENPAAVIGWEITAVSRRAKIIRIHLASPESEAGLNLLIHLKMTGQIIYLDDHQKLGGGHPTADWVNQLPSKHTRVVIELSHKAKLYFNDQRLFGWIKAVTDQDVEVAFTVIGPDIVDSTITPEYLYLRFQKRTQAIKQVIMDSSLVAGVGNIYACDALNLAHIHPNRPAKSLSSGDVEKLVSAMKEVIFQGIELGGTTFDGKYVDIDGMAGKYQSVVRVYGRAGKKCLFCEGEIIKTKLGGRGTYFCASCQV